MIWLAGVLYGLSFLPLWRAWRANRHTSLAHAIVWALVAWLAWALVILLAGLQEVWLVAPARFLALCLLGCAGVAVLGARRPGVAAWNFVVLGLLAVLLLWQAEGFLGSGTVELGVVRSIFLVGTLAVGILNYLPTRLVLAAILLSVAAGSEVAYLWKGEPTRLDQVIQTSAILALAPWAGWALARRANPGSPFDRSWQSFRDRYGFMWGQRLREQFNRSAANSGWPVELGWNGLRTKGAGPDEAELLATLQALMKRFGVADQ